MVENRSFFNGVFIKGAVRTVLAFSLVFLIMVMGCSDNGTISEVPDSTLPTATDDYSYDLEYQVKTTAGADVSFNFGIAASGDYFYTVSGAPDSRIYRTSISTATAAGIFGGPGSGSGQLDAPWDLAVFNDSALFVSDSGNGRIQKFTTAGSYVSEFNGSASGTNLVNPKGIAVSSSGYVFVVDSGLSKVRQFDVNGNFIKDIGLGSGSSEGQLNAASDVAVDSDGNIYVSDTGNHRVVKFTYAGVYALKWGSYGTGAGQFISPAGIMADSSGNIFVADAGNGRVQRFDRLGRFLDQIGSYGAGLTNFNFPSGMAMDASGRLFVVDKGNKRVKRYSGK